MTEPEFKRRYLTNQMTIMAALAERAGPKVGSELVKAAEATAALMTSKLKNAQLPEGMQDCVIVFKECDFGHGRLTATNWVDHGCPKCQADQFKKETEFKIKMLCAHLDKAAKQFRRYELQYAAKGTPESKVKADVNGDLAEEMEFVLRDIIK